MSIRSQLYRAARDLGNTEAVEHHGPVGVPERIARRSIYRHVNKPLNRFLRSVGLSGRR